MDIFENCGLDRTINIYTVDIYYLILMENDIPIIIVLWNLLRTYDERKGKNMVIDDKLIQEEVEKSVRKRIKEMQGDYTSKGFITNIINQVIYEKVIEEIPEIEEYINEQIREICCEYKKSIRQMEKSEILNLIIDKLLYELDVTR